MVDRGGCGCDLTINCEMNCPFDQTYPAVSHIDCYENGVKKYMETKEKKMKKYTKDEMLERGRCKTQGESYILCIQCPYEGSEEDETQSMDNCLTISNEKYMKEKGLKSDSITIDEMTDKKDPLTYQTLALAINHEIKICHKNMPDHEWIIYYPTQELWKDNNAIVYSPVFSKIEDWSHWTKPKPEFKPYSIDIWLDTDTPNFDAACGTFTSRLFGYHSDYSLEETKTYPHKFKITVEKAED